MDSTNHLLFKSPWYFSSSLYQRLSNATHAAYRSCEVTQQDPEWGFIYRLFQASKPKNYSIGSVCCIHNSALVSQFQYAIATQEEESQSAIFAPKWSQEEPIPLREKVMKRWEQMTKPYNPFSIQWPNQRKDTYSQTKILPLWHGTKAAICPSICTTGFTTFGKHEIIHGTGITQNSDIGYFGSGIYFTTSASYAASIYSDGTLLLAWVSMRPPYPVVADRGCLPPDKPSDMKKLEGLGAYQNYNAHYIPVISINPLKESCGIYYPCAEHQEPVWDEIVVFQKSQALPSFWITLQPDFLKSPSLPTVQHLLDHVLNLLENTAIRDNHTLFQLLEQKTHVLIALNSGDPLSSPDQEFYNWSVKLLNETGKVRSYVQGKLLEMQNSSSPTTTAATNTLNISSNKFSTAEQKYQKAKSYETGQRKPKNLTKAFQLYEEAALEGYPLAIVETAFCLCYGMGTSINLSRAAQLAKQGLAKNLTPVEKGRALCILANAYEKGYFEGDTWVKNATQAEKFFQEAEKLGDVFSGVVLAWLYFKHQDYSKKEALMKIHLPKLIQQAENGDPIAQTQLGICYAKRLGKNQDEAQAISWLHKAADQGYAQAQYILGVCYYGGRLVKEDEAQAISWLHKAADQGYAQAQYILGVCYYRGILVKKDEAQAILWYQKAANQGYAQAQYALGICYIRGYGVKQDQIQAVFWFQKAVDQHHAQAQHYLGFCYATGLGVKQDKFQAIFWYQKAADEGDAQAQYTLGVYYANGIDVKQDDAQAAFWYQKAANQGHTQAQYNLGVYYANGIGVKQDDAQAAFWYKKAADQGDSLAQYALGVCYIRGRGVTEYHNTRNRHKKKDAEQMACFWFEKAADQNLLEAQYALGVCYDRHLDDVDEPQALLWHKKAADQGHAGAQEIFQELQSAKRPVIPPIYNIPTTTTYSATTVPVSSSPLLEQQYQEAKSYEIGEKSPKNLAKAFQLYEELALEGYAPAMAEVAFCLCYGIGTTINLPLAAQLAIEGLTKNLTSVQKSRVLCVLGTIYEEKYFEETTRVTDIRPAEKFFQEAKKLEDVFGGVFLAMFYFKQRKHSKGEAVIKRYLPRLIEQAEKGHSIAQTQLGFCYEQGHRVSKDQTQAVFWYQKAADQGYPQAQYNLGLCYANGQGVKKDETQAVFWYQKAADQGYPQAQYNLGLCYANGQEVKKDEAQAVFWYHKAADQGLSQAQYNLGLCYEYGQGVKQDDSKAIFWYQKAADQHCTDAWEKLNNAKRKLYELRSAKLPAITTHHTFTTTAFSAATLFISSCPSPEQKYQEAKSFETGLGKAKNLAKAFQLYEELASSVYNREMVEHEEMFLAQSGEDYDNDHHRWAPEIKITGYAPALAEAAFCLYYGIGTNTNFFRARQYAEAALYLAERAKKTLNPLKILTPFQKSRALCVLGSIYEEAKPRFDQAEKYFKEAEASGDTISGVLLARLYFRYNQNLKGEILIKNHLSQLIQQAANGDCMAQALLGMCYANGQGVKKDESQAMIWYQKAADQGLGLALYGLGICYANGQGVEKDETQAIFWYQKAADQGHFLAQYALGMCYAIGQGVKKDKSQEVFWCVRAANQGYDYAISHLTDE